MKSTIYAFSKARHLKAFVLEKNDFLIQDFHLLCEVAYLKVPLLKQCAQGCNLGFQVLPLPDFVQGLLRVGLVRIGVHFFVHHFCPPSSKKHSFLNHLKVLGCNGYLQETVRQNLQSPYGLFLEEWGNAAGITLKSSLTSRMPTLPDQRAWRGDESVHGPVAVETHQVMRLLRETNSTARMKAPKRIRLATECQIPQYVMP